MRTLTPKETIKTSFGNGRASGSDPVLKIIKQYDLILSHANKAKEEWGSFDSKNSLVQAERVLHYLSRQKNPLNPALDNMMFYFRRLILKAADDRIDALEEFILLFSDLRQTWVAARKQFLEKQAQKSLV